MWPAFCATKVLFTFKAEWNHWKVIILGMLRSDLGLRDNSGISVEVLKLKIKFHPQLLPTPHTVSCQMNIKASSFCHKLVHSSPSLLTHPFSAAITPHLKFVMGFLTGLPTNLFHQIHPMLYPVVRSHYKADPVTPSLKTVHCLLIIQNYAK